MTDEGFVCRYIYLPVGVSALLIAEYLSPTSRPLLASVSLSSLLAVSFSLSVNSASLCHITPSARDAAAEACWQRRQEMMPTPRAGIRLITKMDSHVISIPPALPIHLNQTTVGDLTLDASAVVYSRTHFICHGNGSYNRDANWCGFIFGIDFCVATPSESNQRFMMETC